MTHNSNRATDRARIARQIPTIVATLLIVLSVVAPFIALSPGGIVQSAAAEPAGSDGTIDIDTGTEWGNGTQTNVSTSYDHPAPNHVKLKDEAVANRTSEKFWVMRDGETWKAWGAVNDDGTNNDIHYFTSSNGESWEDHGEVLDLPGSTEDPSVIRVNDVYYLYTENSSADNSGIFIYTSTNGKDWGKEGEFDNAYDPQSPVVVKTGGTWYLFYEKFDAKPYYVRYATSSDGITWTDQGTALSEEGSVPDDVFLKDGTWQMYYHNVNEKTFEVSDPKVATSSSVTGAYSTQGSIVDWSTIPTKRGVTSPTVPHKPSGEWTGFIDSEHRVYMGHDGVDLFVGDTANEELRLGSIDEFDDGSATDTFAGDTTAIALNSARPYEGSTSIRGQNVSLASRQFVYDSTSTDPNATSTIVNIDNTEYAGGLLLHYDPSTGARYELGVTPGNSISLDKWDGAGNKVTIDSVPASSSLTDTHLRMTITRNGQYINATVANIDGSEVAALSGTDTTYTTGRAGLMIWGQERPIWFDNFVTKSGAGRYTSEWHSFESSEKAGIETLQDRNGGSLDFDYRSATSAGDSTTWYDTLAETPENEYYQVRIDLSAPLRATSPAVDEYHLDPAIDMDSRFTDHWFTLTDNTGGRFSDDPRMYVYHEGSIYETSTFNHNNRASVPLENTDVYTISVVDTGGYYEALGFRANDTDTSHDLEIGGDAVPNESDSLEDMLDVRFDELVGEFEGSRVVMDSPEPVTEFNYTITGEDGTVYNRTHEFDEPTSYYEGWLAENITSGMGEDATLEYGGTYENGTTFSGTTSFSPAEGGVFGPTGAGGDGGGTSTTIGGILLLVGGAYALRRTGALNRASAAASELVRGN